MEDELKAFVLLSGGPACLKDKTLIHLLEGNQIWCTVTGHLQGANDDSEAVFVADSQGHQFPHPVTLQNLRIGYGTRHVGDPLIFAMMQRKIDVTAFIQQVQQPEVPPPHAYPSAPSTRTSTPFAGLDPNQTQWQAEDWSRKMRSEAEKPAEGLFDNNLFREAIRKFAEKGPLTDYMRLVLQDFAEEDRSWKSKARGYLEIYEESDPKVAKEMAAVLFLANRIHFVSVSCEYMAHQFAAESRSIIRKYGKSETWTLDMINEMECAIREKYFHFKSLAEKEVAKNGAIPGRITTKEPSTEEMEERMPLKKSIKMAKLAEEEERPTVFDDERESFAKSKASELPPEKMNERKGADARLCENEEAEDLLSLPDYDADEIEIDLRSDPLEDAAESSELQRSSLAQLCTEENVSNLQMREPLAPDPTFLRSGVEQVLAELQVMANGSAVIDELADVDWIQNVNSHVLDSEEFVAGSFNSHAAAWEKLTESSSRASTKTVIGIIKNGLKPSFVGTQDASDQKRKRVVGMLRRVVRKEEISKLLSGRLPHQIEFPNHKSAEDNAEFVWDQVRNNIVSGAVEPYAKGKKPKVVNPVGVVFNPKGRLILDAQYPNLEQSVPVSGYIDDGFSADEEKAKCRWILVRILRLFSHLGAHFSLPKCQLEPLQIAAWLGFVVDSVGETFSISEKKLAKIEAALLSVIQSDVISARDLAEMAGKLVSVAPAVLPALLFVRPLFAAMKGKESWDVAFESPDAVKETARLFLMKLREWNGRRWYSYPVGLSSSSDASDVGFGGFVRMPGKELLEVAGTFTAEEAQLSSTARELLGILATLQTAVQESSDRLRFSTCLITTDNLGASHALNKLKSSSPDVNAVLQKFFALCCDQKIDIRAAWKPREELEAEDLLSRQPDASDWGISQAELSKILRFFQVQISVDLFASDTWHTVANFVSLRYSPGCLAANALLQD
ncbi:putative DNA/RNA polymerases [Klebsormidium nitens]|uniref:Putative DNA/RNA polymerases n=1 Tax=Klebsormidium nitens TaxID=105231 RepID=A0A1Y1I5R4_KLENI|nr:putative DNA/RNA polymerases [Klebsormidium nitens]|eukprot:GAQ85833.1 putative DNA/RNA polymerases [Klebsormidium nitens]